MLDIELIKFVEGLPIDYRVRLGKTKIVHKAMAEKYLPSIVHRPKKGFYVPLINGQGAAGRTALKTCCWQMVRIFNISVKRIGTVLDPPPKSHRSISTPFIFTADVCPLGSMA